MNAVTGKGSNVAILRRVVLRDDPGFTLPESLGKGLGSADPVVPLVLAAVAQLLNGVRAGGNREGIGLIALGTIQAVTVAQSVRRDLVERGRISPIAFVNANAAAPLSITCTRLGLKGPTLQFTSGGPTARRTAMLLAEAWIGRGQASAIAIVETDADLDGAVVTTAELVAAMQQDILSSGDARTCVLAGGG